MLRLRPMNETEYQRFLDFAIADYAEEKVKAGNYAPSDATELATQEYRELLPDGADTKDNFLFMIIDETSQKAVGFIWLMIQPTGALRFMTIVNLLIYEGLRGRGYGTQTLQLVEEKTRALGITKITLHTFGHNTGARSLYERHGYRITNVHMAKDLDQRAHF